MNPVYPNITRFTISDKDTEKVNVVQYWGFFSTQDLAEHLGALLMLDIDFGRKCSLQCPSCFRKKNRVDNEPYKDLSYEELLRTIDEAQSIGLREIKICGAGEPLENQLLLQLARDLTQWGIGLSIFTKAHVLGDDEYVAKLYGEYGIFDASALCREFFELKTSFLVSLQSLNPEIQDQLVGGVSGYTQKRNRGLELLAETGFNKTFPTRLAICANPMVRANFDELLDIYIYARERNILPVNAALMVSGKQIDERFLHNNDVSAEEKVNLWLQIYEYNLHHGFSTLEQLECEGVSCMPGIHPCNQIAAGLYLTSNGTVIRCPGDYSKPLGNIHNESIISIWERHRNWPLAGKFNCHCQFKDGITLPEGLYDRLLSKLFAKYASQTVNIC